MATSDEIREALKGVIDPELGVNIVDLGLVYGVDVAPDGAIHVRMTVTSPACPMGQWLTKEVEKAVAAHALFAPSVKVEIVLDPPWEPSMMSDEAERILSGGRP